jgi:probable phosphoglycerate mutase
MKLAPPALEACIYIVRHGETEWNREDRMQGFLESSLTDKGKAQATRRER